MILLLLFLLEFQILSFPSCFIRNYFIIKNQNSLISICSTISYVRVTLSIYISTVILLYLALLYLEMDQSEIHLSTFPSIPYITYTLSSISN